MIGAGRGLDIAIRVEKVVPTLQLGKTGLITPFTGEYDFAEHARFEFPQGRRGDRSTEGQNDCWL